MTTRDKDSSSSSPVPAQGPDIDQQVTELKAAGWTPQTSTIWKSPSGSLFLGPHGAWKRMKTIEDLLALGQIVLVRTFRNDPDRSLGVGLDNGSFYVFDRLFATSPWHMHCGPYSSFADGCEWITAIREA